MSPSSTRPDRLRLLVWSLCAALLATVGAPASAQAAEASKTKQLRAGVAAANITPWLGQGLVGNFGTPPPAEYVHDQLWARCFVLDDGDTRIAVVIADSIYMSREVLDEAKRQINEATDLPTHRILIACTHTHSSVSARWPNPMKPGKELTDYMTFAAHRIADGVRCAIHNLQPARIAWGTVDEPEHVFCRRWLMKPGTKLFNPFGEPDKVKMNPGHRPTLLKPAGPIDPQIAFLALQREDGRPLGLLANYSLHYVGGTGRKDISADYFGMFSDRIQELLDADRLDPPFIAAMSNGTSANINNINFAKPRVRKKRYEQMRYVAHECADAVYRAYKNLTWHDWVPLDMRQRELELGVRKPTPEQLARCKKLLAEPKRRDKYPHERTYARRAIQQHESPDTVRILLQAVRIGDLGIAAIPFEVFTQIGLELKERSPLKPTFTIELANGGYGYLPTPEQHELGGYETWLGTNKVEKQASVKITNALLAMFAELK